MLYIFDQEDRTRRRLVLVLDSFVSLARQRLFRPNIETGISVASLQPTSDAVPLLATLDGFRPSAAAIVNGLALSAILFCMTGIGIRYSWSHLLGVHIPGVGFAATRNFPHNTGDDRAIDGAVRRHSEKPNKLSDHLQVDVLPVEPEGNTRSEPGTSHASDPAGFPLSPAAILQIQPERYVGKYVSSSGLKIFVRMKGDQLSLRLPGQTVRTISPVSEMRFAIVGSDGWVNFMADDQGVISSLSLSERGNIIHAKRQ